MANELNLSDAARAARNEYLREWRKNNPEKARAIRERYWEKKALEAAAEQEQAYDEQRV